MKITNIDLCNFGSYEDCCSFNLNGQNENNRVVVIGGKNGAGKTTLFTALQVCLYGHLAFGYKSIGKIYFKEIFALINNKAILDENNSAYIRIIFQHTESQNINEYDIKRYWTWKGGILSERLEVLKNGESLSGEQINDFQNYLVHLIPPDMLRLYFFDGEKIADYFLSDQSINIREALMILSGNDTFDILHENILRIVNSTKSQNPTAGEAYVQAQSEKKDIQNKLNYLIGEMEELQAESERLDSSHEYYVSEYAKRGGLTLEEWKELQNSIKEEDEKRERLNWQRKSLATDVLPFIIAKDVVEKVIPQMEREDQYYAYSVLSEKLSSSFVADSWKKALLDIGSLSEVQADTLIVKLSEALLDDNCADFVPILNLSGDEKMQVHSVLKRVLETDPASFSKYQKRIANSLQRAKQLRTKLQDSDIEHIEEYAQTLASIEADQKVARNKLTLLTTNVEEMKALLEDKEKQLAGARKDFESVLKRTSLGAISGRVLLLLEDLQSFIYTKLIKNVENDLNLKFRQLIRKTDFFDWISIDSNFDVHIIKNQIISVSDIVGTIKNGNLSSLKNKIGLLAVDRLIEIIGGSDRLTTRINEMKQAEIELPVEINKNRMSSGEKQIFVMSLYWALMKQSKNMLPFVIDTPFARIDTEHRRNITEHFFMDLPGQIFVLSTNEELSQEHLKLLGDHLANSYVLEYTNDKRTIVHEGFDF